MKTFTAVSVTKATAECIRVDDFVDAIYSVCEDIAALLPDDCSTEYNKGYYAGLRDAFSKVYPLLKKEEDC